jgi:hypothetical protein
MNLVMELERLADALASESSDPSRIAFASVAERIAKALSVRTDEVAILDLSHRWRHLHFVVPEALKNVGFIPLSSKTALAARTTRESRPEIINDFTSVKHATVFEGVKLTAESANSFRKLSAPQFSPGIKSSASYKSAARALTRSLQALISLPKTSEKCLRSAIHSENSFNEPLPIKFSPIRSKTSGHFIFFHAALRVGHRRKSIETSEMN